MTVFFPKSSEDLAPHLIRPEIVRREQEHGNPRLVVLDVREPEEYEAWRIAGSIPVPLRELEARLPELDLKDKHIVTVCAHGPRSTRAGQFLLERGYHAQTMAGGMVNGWNRVYDVVAVPTNDPNTEIFQLRRIGKGCISYLVSDGKEAIAIDPTIDVKVYIELAEAKGAKLIGAADTHTHADHVSGGPLLVKHINGVYFSPGGTRHPRYLRVYPRTSLSCGEIALSAIASPGHTLESVSYLMGNTIFTGDALFVESVGRPDLGQVVDVNAGILWDTLQGALLKLPNDTLVLPAHYGEGITLHAQTPITASLGVLQTSLPALRMGRQEFVAWISHSSQPPPPNFETIKKINQGRKQRYDLDAIRDLEAGPNRCGVT